MSTWHASLDNLEFLTFFFFFFFPETNACIKVCISYQTAWGVLWLGLPTLTHFNVRLFMFSVSLGVLYPNGGAVLLLA